MTAAEIATIRTFSHSPRHVRLACLPLSSESMPNCLKAKSGRCVEIFDVSFDKLHAKGSDRRFKEILVRTIY